MKATQRKFTIALLLYTAIALIGTCTTLFPVGDPPPSLPPDTTIVHGWKLEREIIQAKYAKQIGQLQYHSDSMRRAASGNKKLLASTRIKVSVLEEKLKEVLYKPDTLCKEDSVVVKEYFTTQAKDDSLCDATIANLEHLVANRDSSIVIFKQGEENLREIQRAQDLQNRMLTEQLNTALKSQRKKIRQNRLLAAGLVFVSGFSTTLIVTQTLK